MPAVASASHDPEDIWEQIKLGSIAGIPDERLAREYGVTREAIRKRRSRQKWPSPSRVEMEQEKARQALKEGRSTLLNKEQPIGDPNQAGSQAVTNPSSALELIGKTKEEVGELNRMVLLQNLSPILRRAVTERAQDFDPQSIKELVALGSFTHKLADLDRPQTAVQVNLGFTPKSGSQHWLDSAQVVEVEGDEGE